MKQDFGSVFTTAWGGVSRRGRCSHPGVPVDPPEMESVIVAAHFAKLSARFIKACKPGNFAGECKRTEGALDGMVGEAKAPMAARLKPIKRQHFRDGSFHEFKEAT